MKLVRKPDPRDGWYEIAPAEAQSLLAGGLPNRPLSEHRAEEIASEIRDGRWRENGESLIFDADGVNLDGQHRLRGIVRANQSVTAYCVFGIPQCVFTSIDQGKSRGGADTAATMEFKNYSACAATVRLILQYQNETITKTGQHRMPQENLRIYLKKNRALLTASVSSVVSLRKGIEKLMPISHACFAYHISRTKHPDKAQEFIEKLSTGADLKKGDAILLFRQRMQDLDGVKHKLTQVERLAMLIKVWNAFLIGRPLGVLRWNRDVEQFPKIEL
jgi:hypothetical protein